MQDLIEHCLSSVICLMSARLLFNMIRLSRPTSRQTRVWLMLYCASQHKPAVQVLLLLLVCMLTVALTH
jgi:hypothetical protein